MEWHRSGGSVLLLIYWPAAHSLKKQECTCGRVVKKLDMASLNPALNPSNYNGFDIIFKSVTGSGPL